MKSNISYKVQTWNGNPEVIKMIGDRSGGIVKECKTIEEAKVFAKTLNDCLYIGQRLYDKDNWEGINSSEQRALHGCKLNYLRVTGQELPLQYNCPA